ncbi:hypothetical protein MMC30_000928 [Trapelia coarctata]|nr:hypothetical protein [Trapelia coarctata]
MDCQRLAYAWFEDCLHNHTSCGTIQQGHESSWYPTRLLDIGTTQEPAIRICITAEERPQGSYMTLSHCWGSAPVVQLKGENAKAMREHVRFEELPQLFQDAVMLARFFKVRYLWIDSLCIEQDSADDFQREATSMSEVYGNAICNIAATSSPDSDTGLFAERLCSESLPYDVFSVKREGQEQWLSVVDTRLWLSNTFETPLNRRAWVLQERLLSPRIIHCGRNQLLWECSEKEACETFPHGLPAYLTSPYFDFKSLEILHGPSEARSRPALQETTTIEDPITNSKDAAHTLTEAPPNHPPRPPTLKAYRLSTAILKSYTRCSLTRPQDKLIALSGLAQRLRLRLQDTYLAGLWLRVLPSQLCWKVLACRQSNGRPSYRPPTYRAPSWSWAAVDGEIDFPTPYFSGGGTSLIRVVDVAVTARSGNAFGQVTGGFVKLQGRLLRGRVACHSDAKRAAELVEVEGKDIGDEQCSVDLDVQPLEQKLDVYLLPIESGSQATWLRGVVLQPATQSPQGTYTRLGVFFAVPRVRGPFYGGIEPGQAGRALLEEEDADAITLV